MGITCRIGRVADDVSVKGDFVQLQMVCASVKGDLVQL